MDHLLALCIQLPKVETVKTAENKITHVIYLKHVLELVDPLRSALVGSENPLLRAYCDVRNYMCVCACVVTNACFSSLYALLTYMYILICTYMYSYFHA